MSYRPVLAWHIRPFLTWLICAMTFWPFDLAAFYPYPERGDASGGSAARPGLLTAITVAGRFRATKISVFLRRLAVVSGHAAAGNRPGAGGAAIDSRPLYVSPGLGCLSLLPGGVQALCMAGRWQRWKCASRGNCPGGLDGHSNIQTSYWRSSTALWQHAVECTTRNACAVGQPGGCLARRETRRGGGKLRRAWRSIPSIPRGMTILS